MRKMVLTGLAAVILGTGAWGVAITPTEAAPAPGKEACKEGGYEQLGFANQGQCVKAANQAARAGEPFPPEEVGTAQ